VGTLYGVLDRLVREGLVEPDRDEIHQGRLRRYYRLTEKGVGTLAAEAERQAANARVATRKLHGWRPATAGGGA
jgi:PadR family transcriptional regulator, regulatory protein PadR